MTSHTTRRFREALAGLPAHVQRQARAAYRVFANDPTHPSLRFKQVHDTRPIYSARVGLGYRALCVREATISSGFGLDRMPSTIASLHPSTPQQN